MFLPVCVSMFFICIPKYFGRQTSTDLFEPACVASCQIIYQNGIACSKVKDIGELYRVYQMTL